MASYECRFRLLIEVTHDLFHPPLPGFLQDLSCLKDIQEVLVKAGEPENLTKS